MTGFLQTVRRFSLPIVLVLLFAPVALMVRWVYVDRQESAFPHLTGEQIRERLQKGMTKEAIIEAVGSPPVVSSDEKSWFYQNSRRSYRKGESYVPMGFSVHFDGTERADLILQGPLP